jgi:hypothetical protein
MLRSCRSNLRYLVFLGDHLPLPRYVTRGALFWGKYLLIIREKFFESPPVVLRYASRARVAGFDKDDIRVDNSYGDCISRHYIKHMSRMHVHVKGR